MTVMFEFDLRVVEVDSTGYYYARWDQAQPITVQATTIAAAYKKAWEVVGEPGRRGWHWEGKCDAIREVTPPRRRPDRATIAQAIAASGATYDCVRCKTCDTCETQAAEAILALLR